MNLYDMYVATPADRWELALTVLSFVALCEWAALAIWVM